jgi:peptidoglycan-associated lipoprotein
MKAPHVAGKLATVAFASLVLAACTSTDTQDDAAAEAAAAEAAAAEAAAQEQAAREAAERAKAEAMAEQKALEDKAKAMGSVFYFAFDSSALTDEARMSIDAHIAAMMGNDHSIRLEGHTDERGTREYNLALGERRANAVRDYMVANGVPSYRIETISYGEENPVAFGSGESNWQQNRRVELKH